MSVSIRKWLFVNVAVLLCVSAFVFIFPVETLAQKSTGRLQGIIVDWQFARILGTIIVFQSNSIKKEITVDNEGAYQIELPDGEYLVKAIRDGFLERKIKFKVEPNEVRFLNMMLDVKRTKQYKCPKNALCL